MSELTENPKQACSVCNPAPSHLLEDIIEEDPAEIAARMHVAKIGAGDFHILEIPGPGETPFKVWQGPFETKLAASLFLSENISHYAAGSSGGASCSDSGLQHFNLTARLLAFLRKHGVDDETLAHAMADVRPWDRDYYKNLLSEQMQRVNAAVDILEPTLGANPADRRGD